MPSRRLIVGLLSLALLSLVGRAESAPQRVGVYRDEEGQWTLQQVDQITDQLRSLGLEVVGLEAGELIDPAVVTPQRLDLLVICEAVRAPAEALNTMARFSRQGGKLMLLGGPYFQQATWPYGQRLFDREAFPCSTAAQHQVIQCSGELDAKRSGHGGILHPCGASGKRYALFTA